MGINGAMSITDATIVSIEKGNIETNTIAPVIAFTVEVDTPGTPQVKAIVKGNIAKIIWDLIKDGQTINMASFENGITVSRNVKVSIVGEYRETRGDVIVLHRISKFVVTPIVSVTE